VVPQLEPPDVMVDQMRGRFKAWWRIRVNLRRVPKNERPAQEALEVDYDPIVEWSDTDREAWERERGSGR